MIGKNITEKRWIVVIVALVIISSSAVVALSIQGLASTKANNLAGSTTTSAIGVVYGYGTPVAKNSTATWVTATLTVSANKVTATFPDGFNLTHIVAFQSDPNYDIQGLLNRSYIFTTVNVKTTGVVLQSAILTFGQQVNSSSLKVLTDKGVVSADTWASTVIYNAPSNTNNLNTSVEMSTLGMLTANFADKATIEMTTSSNHTLTNTTPVSVVITQSYGQPFNLNIITISQVVMLVMGILLIFGVVLGLPRRRDR